MSLSADVQDGFMAEQWHYLRLSYHQYDVQEEEPLFSVAPTRISQGTNCCQDHCKDQIFFSYQLKTRVGGIKILCRNISQR